jgi:hypothetical protein
MRCPKCSYITFDRLETCPSCKKDISKTSKELLGVTFRANIPDFLQFGAQEDEPEEEFEEASADEAEVFDDDAELTDDEVDTEAEDEEELEFAVEEEADEPEDEGIDFDLSDSSETAEQADVDLELSADDDDSGLDLSLDDGLDLSADDGGDNDKELEHAAGSEGLEGLDLSLDDTDSEIDMETAEQPEKKSSLELDGLDLSDLSPSSTGESGSALEELTLENSDDASKGSSQQDGLPDLELDGLDFDAPAKPPAGSATGERFKPSAKTGTALDDFDIDLGDL